MFAGGHLCLCRTSETGCVSLQWPGRVTFQACMAKRLAWGCSLWGDSCTPVVLCTLVEEMVAGQGAKLARQPNQGNFQFRRYDENAVFTISPLFSVGPPVVQRHFQLVLVQERGATAPSLLKNHRKRKEATTSCKQCLVLKGLAWMPH